MSEEIYDAKSEIFDYIFTLGALFRFFLML